MGVDDGAAAASTRNKAIVYALCDRLHLDPNKFSNEISGGYDVMSLFTAILHVSEPNGPLLKKDEIMKWVEFASNFPNEADACHQTIGQLNEDLKQKSVLLGDGLKPSEADIVVFPVLYSLVSRSTFENAEKLPSVIRWMDYVQNKVDFGGILEKIIVNKPEFDFSIKQVDNSEENIGPKKGVVEKKAASDSKSSEPAKQSNAAKEEKKEEASEPSKQSKTAKEEKKKAPQKESAEKDTEYSISILNIQIGIIRKAWTHPTADSLLVEEIDLGDGNLRQVVSGLAKFYSPEDLQNRRVVLITNVKPGKLRDVMSAGLVLCASNQDHTVVEPLVPPEGAVLGERVSFSGYDGKPEDVLNPKKKQLEKITPHLYTDDKGVATFKGIPFMTSAGPCTSSVSNASVK